LQNAYNPKSNNKGSTVSSVECFYLNCGIACRPPITELRNLNAYNPRPSYRAVTTAEVQTLCERSTMLRYTYITNLV